MHMCHRNSWWYSMSPRASPLREAGFDDLIPSSQGGASPARRIRYQNCMQAMTVMSNNRARRGSEESGDCSGGWKRHGEVERK